MSIKKIIAFLVVVLIMIVGGMALVRQRANVPIATTPVSPQSTPEHLCYYQSKKTAGEYRDKAWIRLDRNGSSVSGEFNNYPAEKDSKVGTFSGTVNDDSTQPRTANLIWSSLAEGMQNKEELIISYDPNSAKAAFGEMTQGANGVYVYKDKTAITYADPIPAIDCASLDEIIDVEASVRHSDLQMLTKTSPVLGGTFLVRSIDVDPSANTAAIAYEDGHIGGKGTVAYTYDATTHKVMVTGYTKAK